MFERIIVGVDGLEGGHDAIALADALGAPNADIVLTSAYPCEVALINETGPDARHVVQAGTQKMVEEAAGDDPRHRVRVIDDWSPSRALHTAAEEIHADLIVIGSSQHGALGRVLLGDVSRTTLQGAPCAVAIAPRGLRTQPPSTIASIGVGVNATKESEAALATAAEIAAETGATLHLLTAVAFPTAFTPSYAIPYDWTGMEAEMRAEATKQLAEIADRLDLPVESEITHDAAGKALEGLSDRVDLVVAGSRGWGAFRRVFLGSTTDRLVHRAHCPVLVIPSPVADREPAHA